MDRRSFSGRDDRNTGASNTSSAPAEGFGEVFLKHATA